MERSRKFETRSRAVVISYSFPIKQREAIMGESRVTLTAVRKSIILCPCRSCEDNHKATVHDI